MDSYIASGSGKITTTLEKSMALLNKDKYTITIWPTNSSCRSLPKENNIPYIHKNICIQMFLATNYWYIQ